MSDFVNGDRVEVRGTGSSYWIEATFLVRDGNDYVCRAIIDELGPSDAWDAYGFDFYEAFVPRDVRRRPRPSLEERLAELADDFSTTDADTGYLYCQERCPANGECNICRASFIHALMLAAIEEARDADND